MMGDDCGSRPKLECMDYAEENGMPFVTGQEIIDAWNDFKKQHPELDV